LIDLINWCLTPTLAVFHLYHAWREQIIHIKLHNYKTLRNKTYLCYETLSDWSLDLKKIFFRHDNSNLAIFGHVYELVLIDYNTMGSLFVCI